MQATRQRLGINSLEVGLRLDHAQPVLVEEFIAGDELTVGIIGNKKPRIVEFMSALPATPTGKVDRKALRESGSGESA